jgi:hypothetical protein
MEDVKNTLYLYDRSGSQLHKFDIDVGEVGGIFARRELTEVTFVFECFFM